MIRCPWCSRDYEPVGDGRCPGCGAVPPPGVSTPASPLPPPPPPGLPPPPGFAPPPPADAGPIEGQGLPWERRAEHGFFGGLFATVRLVLFQPGAAFRAMRREGSLTDPLLFALILGTAGMLMLDVYLSLQLHYKIGIRSPQEVPPAMQELWAYVLKISSNLPLNLTMTAVQAPIEALLLPALMALASHLVLTACRANSGGLGGTFRVAFYSFGATAPLFVFPICYCAGPVWLVWYTAVAAVGLKTVHRTGPVLAVAAALAPLVLCGCCCGIFIAVFLVLTAVAVAKAGGGF